MLSGLTVTIDALALQRAQEVNIYCAWVEISAAGETQKAPIKEFVLRKTKKKETQAKAPLYSMDIFQIVVYGFLFFGK